MFTTVSGNDVPKATMVNPITKLDMLNFLAKDTDPSINQLAPLTNRKMPAIKIRKDINIIQLPTFCSILLMEVRPCIFINSLLRIIFAPLKNMSRNVCKTKSDSG